MESTTVGARWTTRSAKKFLFHWKETHPCVDCSDRAGRPIFYPAHIMDFDHAPGLKRITIGHDPESRHLSEAELREEMSKCDLVCSNCHREREHARQRVRRLMKRTE